MVPFSPWLVSIFLSHSSPQAPASWRYKGARPELPVLYAGAGVAVPGLAFLEKYPDWDLQYFVAASSLPVGSYAIFAAIVVLMGYLGVLCGPRYPKVILGAAAGLLAFTVWTWPRTWHIGTLEEYLAGTAPTLGADFFAFAGPWFFWSGLVFNFCIVSLRAAPTSCRERLRSGASSSARREQRVQAVHSPGTRPALGHDAEFA